MYGYSRSTPLDPYMSRLDAISFPDIAEIMVPSYTSIFFPLVDSITRAYSLVFAVLLITHG